MDDDEEIKIIFETEENNYLDIDLVHLVLLVKEDSVCEHDYEFIDF
jgi:hypothetical protein